MSGARSEPARLGPDGKITIAGGLLIAAALTLDRNKSIKSRPFLTDKPVASNAVLPTPVAARAFCDPLATPGDFIHRDRLYLSTVPGNGAHNHKRPDEESRSGGLADFKWPSLRI